MTRSREINFGASSYQKPNDPSEYRYAYLFVWTASFIEKLGRIGLSFDPYMVNSGEWYVISANTIDEKLTDLADVILNVKDRVVEKCGVEVGGKAAGNVEYSDVFLSLVRSGITHVPPDIQSARVMTQELYFVEQDLIKRLGDDFGVERVPTTPITMVTLSGAWDTALRLQIRIQELKQLTKRCEDLSDGMKGAAITEAFIKNVDLKNPPQRNRKMEIRREPKQIN